ncbi:MAG: pyridoxamine 5'-phosphate oxidase family protein [Planctomycetota bacterium]
MSEELTQEQKIAKLDELIRQLGTCMFTTVDADNGKLYSRPMHAMGGLDGGKLHFFAYCTSAKIDDVKQGTQVNCAFACVKSQDFVSLSGAARLRLDRAEMEAKWDTSMLAWFPDGLDTSGICLIEVDVDDAQYWDAPNHTLIHLYGVAKAMLTGEGVKDAGENAKVSL